MAPSLWWFVKCGAQHMSSAGHCATMRRRGTGVALAGRRHMTRSLFVRWVLWTLHLWLVPASALAQTKEFEPQVGQAGKDVVWVPTPQVLVDKMLELAKLTPQDYLIDLGSGDGRTVITAAKRGARALGIEYNPEMVELSN